MTPEHYLERIKAIIEEAAQSLDSDDLEDLHLLLGNVVYELGDFLEEEE